MSMQLPADLTATIQSFSVSGQNASEEEVMREALAVLTRRQGDLQAIRQGMQDEADGQLVSGREVVEQAKQRLRSREQ